MTVPQPSLQALLICDQILHDQQTGKFSAIGIFTKIHLPTFPWRHPMLGVYASFSDAHGEYAVELQLADQSTQQVIGTARGPKLTVPHRLAVVDFSFTIANLSFPHAGQYEFRLLANSELLGGKTVWVEGPPPAQAPPTPPGQGG